MVKEGFVSWPKDFAGRERTISIGHFRHSGIKPTKGKIVCPCSQPPIFGLQSNFPLKVKSWDWKVQFMDYASVVSSAPGKRKSKIVIFVSLTVV